MPRALDELFSRDVDRSGGPSDAVFTLDGRRDARGPRREPGAAAREPRGRPAVRDATDERRAALLKTCMGAVSRARFEPAQRRRRCRWRSTWCGWSRTPPCAAAARTPALDMPARRRRPEARWQRSCRRRVAAVVASAPTAARRVDLRGRHVVHRVGRAQAQPARAERAVERQLVVLVPRVGDAVAGKHGAPRWPSCEYSTRWIGE